MRRCLHIGSKAAEKKKPATDAYGRQASSDALLTDVECRRKASHEARDEEVTAEMWRTNTNFSTSEKARSVGVAGRAAAGTGVGRAADALRRAAAPPTLAANRRQAKTSNAITAAARKTAAARDLGTESQILEDIRSSSACNAEIAASVSVRLSSPVVTHVDPTAARSANGAKGADGVRSVLAPLAVNTSLLSGSAAAAAAKANRRTSGASADIMSVSAATSGAGGDAAVIGNSGAPPDSVSRAATALQVSSPEASAEEEEDENLGLLEDCHIPLAERIALVQRGCMRQTETGSVPLPRPPLRMRRRELPSQYCPFYERQLQRLRYGSLQSVSHPELSRTTLAASDLEESGTAAETSPRHRKAKATSRLTASPAAAAASGHRTATRHGENGENSLPYVSAYNGARAHALTLEDVATECLRGEEPAARNGNKYINDWRLPLFSPDESESEREAASSSFSDA